MLGLLGVIEVSHVELLDVGLYLLLKIVLVPFPGVLLDISPVELGSIVKHSRHLLPLEQTLLVLTLLYPLGQLMNLGSPLVIAIHSAFLVDQEASGVPIDVPS